MATKNTIRKAKNQIAKIERKARSKAEAMYDLACIICARDSSPDPQTDKVLTRVYRRELSRLERGGRLNKGHR